MLYLKLKYNGMTKFLEFLMFWKLWTESHYCNLRFKDGKELKTDSNIKITKDTQRYESYSLTLNIAKGSDSGDYEVKVVNSMGEVTSKSRVIVQGKIMNFIYFKIIEAKGGLMRWILRFLLNKLYVVMI